jgi:hypothetical protein
MVFVRIRQLLKKDVGFLQGPSEHHALLVVDVVIYKCNLTRVIILEQ